MSPKNPRTPGTISITETDLHTYDPIRPLWRLHTIKGHHPTAWDTFRDFGPLSTMRWDPHPLPRGHHPEVGVAYCATDPTTAFAEIFQSRRKIRINPNQALSAWFPTRPLRLLDLTGMWLVRNGASASLTGGPRPTCRAWAQAISGYPITPALDGLYVPSTLTQRPMVVLFLSAVSAFPPRPRFSGLLTGAGVKSLAADAANELTWPLV